MTLKRSESPSLSSMCFNSVSELGRHDSQLKTGFDQSRSRVRNTIIHNRQIGHYLVGSFDVAANERVDFLIPPLSCQDLKSSLQGQTDGTSDPIIIIGPRQYPSLSSAKLTHSITPFVESANVRSKSNTIALFHASDLYLF